MKILILAAVALLVPAVGQAAMPAETYAGPLGDRLLAGFSCVAWSVRDRGVVLPQFIGVSGSLAAGQYRNPTSCAVEGTAAGPQF